jgi:predicted Zn-dependent protease
VIRTIRTVVYALILAYLAWILIWHFVLIPPPRRLPTPIRPSVLIVPIGRPPVDDLAKYAPEYRSEYGLDVRIGGGLPLDAAAFDPARRQVAAQDLIADLAAAHSPAPDQVVIGITAADLYIRGSTWRFAFALRQPPQLAVISSARLPTTRNGGQIWQFRKLVTRELGFLSFDLRPSPNRFDLLYENLLSSTDLFSMSWHL